MMKSTAGVLVAWMAVAVAGQDATLVFYDGFDDSLKGWTATNFTIAERRFRPDPTAEGLADRNSGPCDLRRWFDEAQGWALWRYDYLGIDPSLFGGWGYHLIGLEFASQLTDTVKSFVVQGNFWSYEWPPQGRLPPGCAVHRYADRGGYLAFHVPALDDLSLVLLDNICLYLLGSSAMLDSAAYMRDIALSRPDVQWGDSSFALTYCGIPMRGRSTLLVHLAVSDTARRPRAYYVNNTFVGCPNEPFLDYDEISFGWRPGADTVSVGFWGLRDSIVYTAQELTIFTLDLDTAADPRAAQVRAPQGRAVRREPFASGSVAAVFDVRGRRILPRGVGQAPGVYLRSGSSARRVVPTVTGMPW